MFCFTPQGRDKYENEDLIKYSLPHDIWFHVDALSSAHVYVRLPHGQTMFDLPGETLEDAVQLVKANSIQGNKLNNLHIVYTPASNLKKTPGMEVGQVGFYDAKLVLRVPVAKRLNDVVNRLNKTKVDSQPDLAKEREAWDKEQRSASKAAAILAAQAEKEAIEESRRQTEVKQYTSVLQEDIIQERAREMRDKYATAEEYEDDFF